MSDSDDDVPLALRRANPVPAPQPSAAKKPATAKPAAAPRPKPTPKRAARDAEEDDDGDGSETPSSSDADSEDVPLSQRHTAKRAAPKRQRQNGSSSQQRTTRASSEQPGGRASSAKGGTQVMWTTLKHCGVLFPPEYEPHGIKMLYDGKPVDLTPEQEVRALPCGSHAMRMVAVACMACIMRPCTSLAVSKPVPTYKDWQWTAGPI